MSCLYYNAHKDGASTNTGGLGGKQRAHEYVSVFAGDSLRHTWLLPFQQVPHCLEQYHANTAARSYVPKHRGAPCLDSSAHLRLHSQ